MDTKSTFSVIVTTRKQTRSKEFANLTDAILYFDNRVEYYKKRGYLNWIILFNLTTFEKVIEYNPHEDGFEDIQEKLISLIPHD